MPGAAMPTLTGEALEALYERFNRRECVHPDPIEFLYDFADPLDREIVGMVAASLAYGKVAHIMRSVGDALERMGVRSARVDAGSACTLASPTDAGGTLKQELERGTPRKEKGSRVPRPSSCLGVPAGASPIMGVPTRPTECLREASPESLERVFAGFRHRFARGHELARLLLGLKRLIERHGSLGACFASHLKAADETVAPALGPFVREFRAAADGLESHLLPDPSRGSACKRLNLFLRWMVRRDEIDPGGWDGVSPARLIVPLDVHMHRICGSLGLTKRAAADLRAALEITAAFRAFDPDDPVRYDFAISHLGIRGEGDILLSQRDG